MRDCASRKQRGNYRRDAEGAEKGEKINTEDIEKNGEHRESGGQVRDVTLIAGDACDPGDAYQAVFYLDVYDITRGEAVEIAAVNWNAFEAMARTPGVYDEATAGDWAGHRESADHASLFDVSWRTIEGAVGIEQRGEQPRQRQQPVIDALQGFDFLVPKRATFDDDGQAEREKKHYSDKNYDAVEFQGWVAAAGNDEGDCADKKQRSAIEQRATQRKFRSRRTEAAGIADIAEPFSPAVQTTRHREVRPPWRNGSML